MHDLIETPLGAQVAQPYGDHNGQGNLDERRVQQRCHKTINGWLWSLTGFMRNFPSFIMTIHRSLKGKSTSRNLGDREQLAGGGIP
jgi:hypothetical protein